MRLRVLSSLISSDKTSEEWAPPTEFRIFRAGVNPSSKGTFLFDEQAAASVMADFAQGGVDLMIDLEHMSLENPAKCVREDASDARGWCALAVRNGELWAVDAKWTEDGARRLRQKTQRYTSPAFLDDVALGVGKDGRVMRMVNVALCGMPATHEAQALVAASKGFTPNAMQRAGIYVFSERMKSYGSGKNQSRS